MIASNISLWMFGIGAIVILAALWLGRGIIFRGMGIEVGTKEKPGDVQVGNRANVGGEIGNVTGLRGGLPSEGQNVVVGNDLNVRPGAKAGDITGVDAIGANPVKPK